VTLVVRGGFPHETVLGFTLAQLRAYSIAVERARRRENRDLLVLLRGSQYDKTEFMKLLGALEQ